GSGSPDSCCCKTIPQTAEKEIIPVYAIKGRMECSTDRGDCVDDVQCNGAKASNEDKEERQPTPTPTPTKTSTNKTTKDGVQPPPVLGPQGTGDAIPKM